MMLQLELKTILLAAHNFLTSLFSEMAAVVAEIAIMIWPTIAKYVNETFKGPKGKVPKIQSTVQARKQDPLITAKLSFLCHSRKHALTLPTKVSNR